MTVHDWEGYLLNYINCLLEPYGKTISISNIEDPLTGDTFGFSANDLYELYHQLCQKTGIPIIVLFNFDDFYTIRNIANCLYENHKFYR